MFLYYLSSSSTSSTSYSFSSSTSSSSYPQFLEFFFLSSLFISLFEVINLTNQKVLKWKEPANILFMLTIVIPLLSSEFGFRRLQIAVPYIGENFLFGNRFEIAWYLPFLTYAALKTLFEYLLLSFRFPYVCLHDLWSRSSGVSQAFTFGEMTVVLTGASLLSFHSLYTAFCISSSPPLPCLLFFLLICFLSSVNFAFLSLF